MNVKEFHATTGKSPADFAKDLGISESHVIKLIYGLRCPSAKLMVKLKERSNGLITSDDCQAAYLERLYKTTN